MHFFDLQFCLLVFLICVKFMQSLKLCYKIEYKNCVEIPHPKHCINLHGYHYQNDKSIDGHTSSIIIEHEKCVILYDRYDCSGIGLMVSGNYQLSNHEMNNKFVGVGPCVFDRQLSRDEKSYSQRNTTTALELKHQTDVTSNSDQKDSYSGIVQLLKMLNDRVNLLESKSANQTDPTQEIINFGSLNIYYNSKPQMSNVTSS